MTSRQRVQAVLNRTIPDRIPNGLGGCETTGMHVVAYDNLKKLLGCAEKPTRVDTFMTNAVFEEDVIAAMKGDVILLDSPAMCKSRLRGNVSEQWKEQELWGKTYSISVNDRFTLRDDGVTVWETAGGAICPKGGYYFDHNTATDLSAELYIPDPDKYAPPHSLPEDKLRHLEEQAKRLYNETELSICVGETICDLQVSPGGMVNTMLLMLEEPDVMKELLERSLNAGLSQLKELEQAVGKYADVLSIAHDFGDNRGVTVGEVTWREIYKPFYKRLFDGWHSITNMKINLHSCGSISAILDDLIECGADIINPIQTSAANMEAEEVKKRFGERIILWGGAYDAQLLPHTMTYDEVYKAVYGNIKTLGRNGGYIFSGVHNLPADMPMHHVKAMMDAYFDAR